MVLELDYFSTLRIVLDCSMIPYRTGASLGLSRLESVYGLQKSA